MAADPQYSITCKLTRREINGLDLIALLAGWRGRSTALREFMKIWVEVALVTMETDSSAKGTWAFIKQVKRLHDQMKVVKENAKKHKEGSLISDHDMQVLRDCLQ